MKTSILRSSGLFYLLISVKTLAFSQEPSVRPRESVIKLVAQIRKADYEDDRAALSRLYAQLNPFVENQALSSRVRYWRGFALWRRAINGFNDSADLSELERDLNQAVTEFDQAIAGDPEFADAKAGAASCLMMLAYSFPNRKDPAKTQEVASKAVRLLKEAYTTATENPRVLWVRGGALWYVPAERGGGQAAAMATFSKGLEESRKHNKTASDELEPSWGEPELLMSLAWANLNQTTPNPNSAEQNAEKALELVPNWHYVRDILLWQIAQAKTVQRK